MTEAVGNAGAGLLGGRLVTFVSHGRLVTEAVADAVVRPFVSAVNGGNIDRAIRLLHFDWIFESVADQSNLSPSERDALRRVSCEPLFRQIHADVAAGGEYAVLHPIRRRDEVHIIVRLWGVDGRLNYHEFMLRRNESAEVEIADWYAVASGERLSEFVQRFWWLAMGPRKGSLVRSRKGQEAELDAAAVRNLRQFAHLVHTSAGQALSAYHNLPPRMQKLKASMLLKVRACANIGDDYYVSAFEDYRRAFPDDPSTNLLGVDYYFTHDDPENAIASAERLKAYLGGPVVDETIENIRSQ